eukprot:5177617-Heterocapsa_arctica.AAC.1
MASRPRETPIGVGAAPDGLHGLHSLHGFLLVQLVVVDALLVLLVVDLGEDVDDQGEGEEELEEGLEQHVDEQEVDVVDLV